eukprot:TRINITY_DN5517_c0_g2_i2.p1 TRINITY_DN5517_c0_g2~~TRINITY_DN5517_c0_g2_i2.p1  ORF type:complete len:383 (-),score=114.97 TRINITY_DN5517_c0_g2_i2:114-1262(-)
MQELNLAKVRRENELGEVIKDREEELEKKVVELMECEELQKELAEELKRCHTHIDNQRICIEELKEENKCALQLSYKLKEAKEEVEKVSKELSIERQKKEELAKEKYAIERVMETLKLKYSKDNLDDQLKIEAQRKHIEELEADKRLALEQQSTLEEENSNAINSLHLLFNYIESTFSSITVDTESEVVKPLKNKEINNCINGIKDLVRGVKRGMSKSWKLLEEEGEEVKKELAETNAIKEDVMAELERFKSVMDDQELLIKEKQDENALLVEENQKLTAQLEEYKKEVHDSLDGIISKYKEMQPKYINTEKKSSSIELVSIIAGIMNALSGKVKNLKANLEEEKTKTEKIKSEVIKHKRLHSNEINNFESILKVKQKVTYF